MVVILLLLCLVFSSSCQIAEGCFGGYYDDRNEPSYYSDDHPYDDPSYGVSYEEYNMVRREQQQQIAEKRLVIT